MKNGSEKKWWEASWRKQNSRKKKNLRNTITDNLETRECYFERKKNVHIFVLFSCSVLSNSMWPHKLQHVRLLGPSPNSQSLLKLMSVVPFSCLQSFPASGFFFNESALCIGWPKHWSFSFSISPSSEYSVWFPLGLTGLILQSKGLSRVFSSTTVQNHLFMYIHVFTWQYNWKIIRRVESWESLPESRAER